MLHPRDLLPLMICATCLISCCAPCSPDIGKPLDLIQFTGEWFFVAGTPINESLSRCGQFLVRQTSANTFAATYTALSYKNDVPVVFHVNGDVNGNEVMGTWQFQGSQRKLGPFRHVIAFVNYDSVLGMLVCSENTAHHQGYKFAMIWSRKRSLRLPTFKGLKSKLGAYINEGRIRMVDHGNC